MDIVTADYLGIIGALIGVVGCLVGTVCVIIMRSLSIQMDLLRGDHEKLCEQVGELRGSLSETRENYIRKPDFDGAIIRLIGKLDSIDMKVSQSVSRNDCQGKMRELHEDISNERRC